MYAGSALVNVQIPTSNATACGMVRAALYAAGMSVSGWTSIAGPPLIQCYFRISGQVYLDMTDIHRMGEITLTVLHAQGAYEGTVV